MDIVAMAFELARAVKAFVEHARGFYYEVMLSGLACPRCGGSLVMLREGSCQCTSCRHEVDPTVAFQRCPACDGQPRLRRGRYQCSRCGAEVVSRFLFDGLVFDREYFRKKMAEFRERKQQEHVAVRIRVAEARSGTATMPAAELASIPGLVDALNGLVLPAEIEGLLPLCRGFDLGRHQRHLEAHIGPIETCFDDIPALEDDARKDRIWRFVAVIFLAHEGILNVWQEGETIMVAKHETDREGQGVPGALEAADGV